MHIADSADVQTIPWKNLSADAIISVAGEPFHTAGFATDYIDLYKPSISENEQSNVTSYSQVTTSGATVDSKDEEVSMSDFNDPTRE